jgi:hypothetical protein
MIFNTLNTFFTTTGRIPRQNLSAHMLRAVNRFFYLRFGRRQSARSSSNNYFISPILLTIIGEEFFDIDINFLSILSNLWSLISTLPN